MPLIEDVYLLFFDGSFYKIHDAASSGIVLYDPKGKLVLKRDVKIVSATYNEAEYAMFEVGFQICLQHEIKHLQIKCDSVLVMK